MLRANDHDVVARSTLPSTDRFPRPDQNALRDLRLITVDLDTAIPVAPGGYRFADILTVAEHR